MRQLMRRIGAWFLVRAGAEGAYGAGLRYLERGGLLAAADAFEDAQRLWEREMGPLHGYVAMAMAKRAFCYVRLGRVQDGVSLYENAIALESELRGDQSPRVQDLAAELAWARTLLGGRS